MRSAKYHKQGVPVPAVPAPGRAPAAGAAGHPVEAPRFAHGPVLWDLAGLGYSARGFRRDAGPRNRERKA